MRCIKLRGLPFLLIVFCMALLMSPRAKAEKEGEKNVCFRWAFGAMVGPEDDRRLVAITDDTTLKTGNKLKLLVEPQNKCFVYLIYHSGQDDVLMLFPYDLDQFSKDYQTSKKYFIPQGTMWFELDEKVGLENFYLLASATRLVELEALFEKHKSEGAIGKQKRAKQILTQIHKIKRRYGKLTTDAERPVSIGGSVRGSKKVKELALPDFYTTATEVSAHNFYSRTFTIEHQ